MNKQELFALLDQQPSIKILELLKNAYSKMNAEQRRLIFGKLITKAKTEVPTAKKVIKNVVQFYEDSLEGRYYAPFSINSKNFSYIPEETEEWFTRVRELLDDSVDLSEMGDDRSAVKCFKLLNELIDRMSSGEEIVFADEYGTWMIGGDKKRRIKAYVASLAKIAGTDEFVELMLPIIRRDSLESFSSKAYSLIRRAANKEQKVKLDAEISRQKIRVSPNL